MDRAVNQTGAAAVDGGLRRAVRRLAALLGAEPCLLCGEAGLPGQPLCRPCRDALPWNAQTCARCALPLPPTDADAGGVCGACLRRPPPQAAARAAFVYEGGLRRLLPRAKFHGDLAAARLLSGLMAERWRDVPRPQALVPVPLHAARLRRRGYDQALELAKPLARALGMPLRADALRRVRDTAAQSDLSAAQRRRNLRDAFAVRADATLPAHVAVFDDVMTTGATAHAAVRALTRAGVARVELWVCARVR
ncbi:MAG TPA: ComF family protein [Lysobacter sp.]|nr:ComF family protein [Lysobacter sp.]